MRFPVSPLAYEVRLGVTRKGSARAQRRRTALADRLQRLQRLVEVADLDQGDPRLRVVQRLRAVAFRREEDGRLGELGGHQLLRDAADLPDPALVVDGAGAGDDLPADPVELDRQGERMRLLLLHPYAEPGVAVLGPGGGQRDLLGLAAADIADHASRAWRLGPDQLAELLYRRHRRTVNAVDDVADLEHARGRQPLDLLGVLLVDLLLGPVWWVDQLARHHRVVARQPAADRLEEGDVGVHPDRHQPQLTL